MIKKLCVAMFLLFVTTLALDAQSVGILTYSGGVWSPAVSTSTSNPVGNVSEQVRVYCYNAGLGQWVPGDSNCFGGGGGSGTVSGQAAGVIPLATGPTSIESQAHINENTSGITIVSQKFNVTDTAVPLADNNYYPIPFFDTDSGFLATVPIDFTLAGNGPPSPLYVTPCGPVIFEGQFGSVTPINTISIGSETDNNGGGCDTTHGGGWIQGFSDGTTNNHSQNPYGFPPLQLEGTLVSDTQTLGFQIPAIMNIAYAVNSDASGEFNIAAGSMDDALLDLANFVWLDTPSITGVTYEHYEYGGDISSAIQTHSVVANTLPDYGVPPTASENDASGTFAPGTYFFKLEAYDEQGNHTIPSPEGTFTQANTGTMVVSWTYTPRCTGGLPDLSGSATPATCAAYFKVFIGTSSGAENHYLVTGEQAGGNISVPLASLPSGTPTAAINTTGQIKAQSFEETLHTPASSSEACTAGQFTDDANFHYVCTATNTWKRVALSTF